MKGKEIRFEFNGGLGNQIFQYLAAKYIQNNIRNYEVNFIESSYLKKKYRNLDINNITNEPLSIKSQYPKIKLTNKILLKLNLLNNRKQINTFNKLGFINQITEEVAYRYESKNNPILNLLKILKEFKGSSINVEGFWQNPNIYSSSISRYYKFFKNTEEKLPKNILANKYIAIHVRRGDYINEKRIYNYYFARFSPIQYILSSINILPSDLKNLPIYIVSDEPKWVNLWAEQIKVNNNKLVVLNQSDPLVDWSILRYSSLNICANSTFSFTASMLNKENLDNKIRAIIPQWISDTESSLLKGWLSIPGFIGL